MSQARDKLSPLLVDLLHDAGFGDLVMRYAGEPVCGGHRLFDAAEQEILTPAARGYLLELSRRREITPQQMELVIQYAALSLSAPLDREFLAALIDRLVLSWPDQDPVFYTSDEGERAH